ncbi:hypothetical protein BDB00DRAFT_326325 [Zychaea mexicana]|uniref:uncharacterized protein n=1 Tax=Zychaea mexicana TaxID=64656 RepID=UPI0022FE1DA3|nr:uncharacterized protein BDB00DRAFT_326325 [Zychaea mexicana]KAI9498929.1 hypothetical protein BDB00DRAFT_326325 [Zychaea mexicana]
MARCNIPLLFVRVYINAIYHCRTMLQLFFVMLLYYIGTDIPKVANDQILFLLTCLNLGIFLLPTKSLLYELGYENYSKSLLIAQSPEESINMSQLRRVTMIFFDLFALVKLVYVSVRYIRSINISTLIGNHDSKKWTNIAL